MMENGNRTTAMRIQKTPRKRRSRNAKVNNGQAPDLGEPIAAVGQPPAEAKDWKGCSHSPPKGEEKIGDKTKDSERHPEDLALHVRSLTQLLSCADAHLAIRVQLR